MQRFVCTCVRASMHVLLVRGDVHVASVVNACACACVCARAHVCMLVRAYVCVYVRR